jgi:flagellar biosynthesis protein FlhB
VSDKSSRTEKATAQKRRKARERGQVFRSREVAGAMSFLAAVGAVAWYGGSIEATLRQVLIDFIAACSRADAPVVDLASAALGKAALAGVPLLSVSIVASLAGQFLQSPPLLTFEPFAPDPKRLFSLSKLANLFSFGGAANLVRGVCGLAAVGLVGYSVLGPLVPSMNRLATMSSTALARFMGANVVRLMLRGGFAYALIAAADYALNHRQFEEGLKMTKQEVKDEHKQLEGDPQIKARVRRAQRASARRRMMAMVPKATVVVTNPTHFAVALQFVGGDAPAPRVVAKGKGELATRIRDVARKSGVVVYEDPPLARALYGLELGSLIPPELYKAVAEVLAHVFKVSGLRK